jgi:hypothetical protein
MRPHESAVISFGHAHFAQGYTACALRKNFARQFEFANRCNWEMSVVQ